MQHPATKQRAHQTLNPEENFLWTLAQQWRHPDTIIPGEQLDWEAIIALAIDNKMTVLLHDFLAARGLTQTLPDASAKQLADAYAVSVEKSESLANVLRDYMVLANSAELPTIPLKGLWVSERIYGNPRMRPGHDLDLLVAGDNFERCVALCEALTFDRYWPGLLPDSYYRRHHLHLELSLPDCWTWVEIHWAFDHPRTLLTIDYDGMFERTTRADLLGAKIWEPAWPDVLMSLAIHLVKHAIYLPTLVDHPELPRILLADGRMMHCLDIAEAIKQYGDEIDWHLLITLTKQAGADNIIASVLRLCQQHFAAPVPDWVIDALPIQPIRVYEQNLYEAMGAHLLAKQAGIQTRGVWAFLVEPNWKFVFRPIRLLDYISYLLPPREFLQRRYNTAGPAQRLRHSASALVAYARLAFDTLADSLRVRIRPLTPDVELPANSRCRQC